MISMYIVHCTMYIVRELDFNVKRRKKNMNKNSQDDNDEDIFEHDLP